MKTKKELLFSLQSKYDKSSVNSFLKNCLSLALTYEDFFSDVIFGALSDSYSDSYALSNRTPDYSNV